jgi:signal transduction histidine kinase
MIREYLGSLQVRLVLRLTVLYVVATAVAIAVLIYQAYETAGTLNDRELGLRAADLARYVVMASDGTPRLDLPPHLAASYQAAGGADIYAMRGADNAIIAALPANFGDLVQKWPAPADEPGYFRLNEFGAKAEPFYGLGVTRTSAAGPVAVFVARAANADALIHSLLREFVFDVAWVIPLLFAVTLAIGVLAIRSGLKPVRQLSEMAAGIGPSSTAIRLPDRNVPNEIVPLVRAVNRALDRLEQGFEVQRQFTANAAHQLRTPITIIAAALDGMEGNGELAKLKADMARMSRLVEQLLRVARLDSVALDLSETVDLNEIGADAVALMAPVALSQRRCIAFSGCKEPVPVKGNAHAIADAVRNLVENAIAHSPEGSEVLVTTSRGKISVADRGSGIPPEDRHAIFNRFWRGKRARIEGAGLGLAIVREIMGAHRGSVSIDDNPGGGSIFTLSFLAPAPAQSPP